jgi:hypothetical protein
MREKAVGLAQEGEFGLYHSQPLKEREGDDPKVYGQEEATKDGR